MKEHFIPNENLKIQANKLFKGIVLNAYIEKYKDVHSDKDGYFSDEEKNNRNEKYFNSIEIEKDDGISYDAKNIILEFNNGAIVVFRNSEWASMSGMDEDIVIENKSIKQVADEIIEELKHKPKIDETQPKLSVWQKAFGL